MIKDKLFFKIKQKIYIKKIINLFYFFLRPFVQLFKTIIIRKRAIKAMNHYSEVVSNIKHSGRSVLNFAAYVIYDSTYGMDGSFKIMMNNLNHWNPKIVVIPDIDRGYDHAVRTYNKTKDYFVKLYGDEYVIDGWNYDINEFYDHLDDFDIVYFANPYDSLVHKFHKIKYACNKNVLPIYVSYGYDIGRYTTIGRMRGELNLVWKIFADTTYTYEDYSKYQIIKGQNVVLTGYSKMDNLYQYFKKPPKISNNKTIMISPHHTVSMKYLPLSNFLTYNDLILELPVMFPNINFIFRPHPLLFTTLINSNIWSNEEVDNYIQLLKERGVEYSVGGNYFDLFLKCDAIINDCGSFTVEWLYTGKPGCFVYNNKLKHKHLTTLMNKAIEKYTVAKSKQDIIDFVESISNEIDLEDYHIDQWFKDNISLNYPNVSEYINNQIDVLKQEDD